MKIKYGTWLYKQLEALRGYIYGAGKEVKMTFCRHEWKYLAMEDVQTIKYRQCIKCGEIAMGWED